MTERILEGLIQEGSVVEQISDDMPSWKRNPKVPWISFHAENLKPTDLNSLALRVENALRENGCNVEIRQHNEFRHVIVAPKSKKSVMIIVSAGTNNGATKVSVKTLP